MLFYVSTGAFSGGVNVIILAFIKSMPISAEPSAVINPTVSDAISVLNAARVVLADCMSKTLPAAVIILN